MKRKIFLTGATGFVGSNLARQLIKDENNEVHILIRESSNTWRIKDILYSPVLIKHFADLLDFDSLRRVMEEVKPDFIIHTAIYGGYSNQKDVKKIIETNLIGTMNLLEATKDIDYKCFINTGSSSEYGTKAEPMKESDLLEPNTEYGVAKSAATLYCSHFAKKNKKPIITLRLLSVYGYFEERGRLVPEVITNYIQGKEINLNNPEVARDFIFIEDVVEAYQKVMNSEKIFYGEVFNVGFGEQKRIRDIAETVAEISSGNARISYGEGLGRSFDSYTWVADISKIEETFGWSPKHSLHDGLAKSIEWFRKNLHFYVEEGTDSLKKRANEMRLEIARLLEKTYGSHIGGDYSVLDILNALYFKILNVNPENPKMKERDKVILSKGHNSLALYNVLCRRGFFSNEILQGYCQNGSDLEGHVNYGIPGVEVSSGSLGHGLAIGIGMAIANKNDKNPGRIFVVMGDGECNEGSIWEAAILGSRLKLDNLTVIVDANSFQGIDTTKEVYGSEKKLIEMWKATGFEVKEIDGHDYQEIIKTLENVPFQKEKPSLIFAHTIKGKGVSFMEDKLEWHYKSPNKEQLKIIEEELDKK
jgi:transketolase